jgi:hypothetical protein
MFMNFTTKILDDDQIQISRPCFVTKKNYSVTVPFKEFREFMGGALVQKAFPGLAAEQREFLVSGTSPEGWNQMFGPNGLEGE